MPTDCSKRALTDGLARRKYSTSAALKKHCIEKQALKKKKTVLNFSAALSVLASVVADKTSISVVEAKRTKK